VRERYDGACSPVLEVDLGSVLGSDGIHLPISMGVVA
jgi:hypothetical protein